MKSSADQYERINKGQVYKQQLNSFYKPKVFTLVMLGTPEQ